MITARVKGTIEGYELAHMLKSEDEQMHRIAEYIIRHYIGRDIHFFLKKYNIQLPNEQEIVEKAVEEYIQQLLKEYDE